MPGKTRRIAQLGVSVLRALHRGGIRPSDELGEVLILQSAVLLAKLVDRAAFLALAGSMWDEMIGAGEVDQTNPEEVRQADQQLAAELAPHTPREALEDLTRLMGEHLKQILPPGIGWAAFAFDLHRTDGFTAYAANANRGDFVKMLQRFIVQHIKNN